MPYLMGMNEPLITPRYTTLEIARRLRMGGPATVQLLRAAQIPHWRCGSSYLWDARRTDLLIVTLRLVRTKDPTG